MATLLQSPPRSLSMADVADISQTRAEAAAGVPEYFIIDPGQSIIHIFQLADGLYTLHDKFAVGTTAISPSLPGLSLDVTELFRQAVAQA